MKVSRFGPKKRPDPSPEDEWLRQALLDAQDADLKTTLQDAPPPYPHTAAVPAGNIGPGGSGLPSWPPVWSWPSSWWQEGPWRWKRPSGSRWASPART